jgi:uncharacterized membrane protein YeaQ/YmgE (transglycosylase-associated protein family)
VVGLVLWTLVGGVVIGLLGKLVAPGDRDNVPLWMTVVCGVAGILVGNLLYVGPFHGAASTPGVDWLRHVLQVGVAAVAVMVAATVLGRRSHGRRAHR